MRLNPFPTHSYHYSSPNIYKVHPWLAPPFPAPNPTGPRARWARMDYSTPPPAAIRRHHRRKDKILVIMGATGTGKSRLSIDLATRFPFFEIINSDKMQVYRGLDITTNKIPIPDRLGVPHHLLGEVDPLRGELTPSEFRSLAGDAVSEITSRRKLPILVGGSNSFIHALLVDRFDSGSDVFSGSGYRSELRYNCCFLWADVSFKVLEDYLLKRVDDMIDSGMVEELEEFYDPKRVDSAGRTGLLKAIGVPEFDRFFEKFRPGDERGADPERDRMREGAFEEALRAIKDNTCQLAKKQIGKILRLQGLGWDLRRLEATEAFRAAMTSDSGKRFSEIWGRQVREPSVKIVNRFLEE